MRLSTRLTVAMVGLVALTATAVGLLINLNIEQSAVPRALDRIDTHAHVLAQQLESAVRGARADVSVQGQAIEALVRAMTSSAATETAVAVLRDRIASRFTAELSAKPQYSRFRLIGIADGGREIVRVDRRGPSGAIRIVPEAELQPHGDRDFFAAAIRLSAGQVYAAPIEFNREAGVVEIPKVPVLLVAAPIFASGGEIFGIMVINLDLRSAFEQIRTAGYEGAVYVANENGDFLIHQDRSKEFGFEFGTPFRIQDEFPDFRGRLARDETTPRIVQNRGGDYFGIGEDSIRLAGGPRVMVFEVVPRAALLATNAALPSILGALIAALGGFPLAILIARSLSRPLVQMTRAVEGFSRGEPIAVPADAGGEIGLLARAFARMGADVREKTAALKREIEERHRIFDTSPDLILLTDSQGNFNRVSPSSKAILGYEPNDMIGHSAAEFVYPDDLEPTRDEMRSARRGQIMRNFDTRYIHKEGRVVTLAWTGVWSEPAQQHFFIGRDMTEQKLVEEKFRLAVEASPSGLVMINEGGTIVLVNAETERMFGYERHELIGQQVDILVPVGVQDHHVQHRTGFAAGPEARRMGAGRDLYALRKDGTEFPVEIGLNPIQTSQGLLVLSVVVDISERKRAEATLRSFAEVKQLFTAAVESSNDAIVTKSLDGVITGWNQAAERLFGFTAQEAIGKSIGIIVPEDLRSEVRGILARIRNGEKVEHQETVRTNKEGRRIDVSLSVSPVRSSKGTIIGAAKVARDITEKKRTERALHDSEQMALGIIANALDAIVQINESAEVIEWNPRAEAIFGWSRQEAIGRPITSLYLPKGYRPRYLDMNERLLQTDKAIGERFEFEALRKDGQKFTAEVSMTGVRRRDSNVYNLFLRDITQKLAAEEQLRQSQKMEAVGQLTGGIAHDFNNMLTVITGTIEILGEAVADKPQLAAIAKLISEAADRGAELTAHLLAFARKQPLQPREIDINVLLVEAVKLLRPTLGEQVEIELRTAENAWPALADPTQLTTALLNLAVNARDAMPKGGKLTLETKNMTFDETYAASNRDVQTGNYVMIAVSDTGQGIPEAIRDKVFEPFFSTKEVGKGTGLGLSMVYGFVKQSGGHIKIYSEEGLGTTIRIYLPHAGAQAEQLAVTGTAPAIEGGDETVLVVEDDAMVRTSVTTQLQSLGYRTISAANAAEALAIIDGGAAFDLLFTDVVMPGPMNGRRLAEETANRRPRTPVLFTSGYTENAIVHHGRLDPGVLLLGKPYRKAELARMVRVALGDGAGPRPDEAPPKTRAPSG